jgi:hypothetical protein
MSRHDATLGLALAIAIVLPGIPASAQSECDEDAEIIGGGGSAGLDCPPPGGDTPDHTTPVVSTPSEGCTDERRNNPELWWLSYDVPADVIDAWFEVQAILEWPEGMTVGVLRDCNGDIRSSVRWVPEPEPGSAGDGEGLFAARERARAEVTPALPTPRVSPTETVVGVETWLWLEGSYWQVGIASDATPSGQVVQVEARPREVIWDLDEDVRICEGPGVPWSEDAQAAFESQSPLARGNGNPACTYVFVHSSTTQPDDVYEASVTVAWEFSWSVDGASRGVFGSVELTESWPLRVGEVQALITG